MFIHDSGIYRNSDNTDTPCKPYVPAILTTIATATPLPRMQPRSPSRFLLPKLHLQIHLTYRPGRSPANPLHGGWSRHCQHHQPSPLAVTAAPTTTRTSTSPSPTTDENSSDAWSTTTTTTTATRNVD
ncbi:unnamed protein product [Schistocephalus solidus]|uniref:Uncharacterized protein n=1 Tax=Schistocephalus solidus TaxID=70667 RepID=A0A183T2L2_SCHSO|nr:unnamed protein product [Schistocephalus solidus]